MKRVLPILAVLILAQVAAADEVRLKNGGSIVGIARENGTAVTIELGVGTVTLPKGEVEAILPGRTVLHEYQERYAEASCEESAGKYYELALWAGRVGLPRHVPSLLERVIEIEPNHAEAHRLLGYLFREGCWLSPREYAAAEGYVEFRGRFLRPTERDEILGAEARRREAERRASEQRRQQLQKARTPEAAPYTLGLPRYAPSRGSQVWGGGWYSTFGGAWYLAGYFRGIRGVVPPLPPYPDSAGGRHRKTPETSRVRASK